jgi:hypothetical protein
MRNLIRFLTYVLQFKLGVVIVPLGRFAHLLLIFLLANVIPNMCSAEEVLFLDTDCRLLSRQPENPNQLITHPGDISVGNCVIIDNEALCHYKDPKTNKQMGKATKYGIHATPNDQLKLWLSKPYMTLQILVDKANRRYHYAGTTPVIETGILITKQCVGRLN